MGSRSRKRQTPDWSTARLDERRSCQSQRRALGLGRRLAGSAGAVLVAPGLTAHHRSTTSSTPLHIWVMKVPLNLVLSHPAGACVPLLGSGAPLIGFVDP